MLANLITSTDGIMSHLDAKTYLKQLRESAAFLRRKTKGALPEAAVVLGSGLADAIPRLEPICEIPYAQIPHFPESAVAGHRGKLLLGRRQGRVVAVLQGRWHYYEGMPQARLIFPYRVLAHLGLRVLVLTSAVGSLKRAIKPGDVVVINDQMNFSGANPLRGLFHDELGPMFPDLTEVYDKRLRKIALAACRKNGLRAHQGVYVMTPGPSYETPAEVAAYAKLGGSVVGMSMVPETIAARQAGVKIVGFSWISNYAAGLSPEVLEHEDVLRLGRKVAGGLRGVLETLLRGL